jgi:hypothetical protein
VSISARSSPANPAPTQPGQSPSASAFMVDWPRLPMPTPRACGSSGWRHADGVTRMPVRRAEAHWGGAQPARRHRAEPAARCYRGCPSRRDGTEPATEGNQRPRRRADRPCGPRTGRRFGLNCCR